MQPNPRCMLLPLCNCALSGVCVVNRWCPKCHCSTECEIQVRQQHSLHKQSRLLYCTPLHIRWRNGAGVQRNAQALHSSSRRHHDLRWESSWVHLLRQRACCVSRVAQQRRAHAQSNVWPPFNMHALVICNTQHCVQSHQNICCNCMHARLL